MPRIINVICDAALVFGYAEERRQIDLPLMREVLAELETTGVLPSPRVAVRRRASVPAAAERPAAACAGRRGRGSAAGGRICDLRAGASTGGSRQPGRDGTGGAAGGRDASSARQALRQRERELAEQRRVLAEEYRLLRVQRAAAAGPDGRVRARHARVSRPAPERFTASRPGFWAWLKRVATGGSHRAMEGN